MNITLIDTIEYFIPQLEGDLEDLSWQIREETNFEDNSIDWLSDEWDEKAKHLENLKQIKSIVENLK
jgi:hypothetical protein